MQKVDRKDRKSHPKARRTALIVTVVFLTLVLACYQAVTRDDPLPAAPAPEQGVLIARETAEVERIEVQLRAGEGWAAVQTAPDTLTIEGDPPVTADSAVAARLLQAVAVIGYNEVLAEDLQALSAPAAEFGLENPREVLTVRYTDGTELTVRIGDRFSDGDETFYYMTADGDSRLLALDVGTAEDLTVDRALLRPVRQPSIQRARIDRISVTLPEEERVWALEGSVTDPDAADRWVLEKPVRYPADGTALENLRKNAANLRLGAFVAEAAPETLTAYGFDSPRAVIEVRMAEGTTLVTGADGALEERDWPGETVTFTLGGAKNDMVDYILFEGDICTVSHFLLSGILDTKPLATLTRYPVLTALSNLRSLTWTDAEGTTRWEVERTEQVAPNNDLVLDAEGNPVWDVTLTRNGAPADWDAFGAAYQRLLVVRVSGVLPADWQTEEAPHTLLTFATETGATHTIALYTFDALHDAVAVDGSCVFYLVRGGLGSLPAEGAEGGPGGATDETDETDETDGTEGAEDAERAGRI